MRRNLKKMDKQIILTMQPVDKSELFRVLNELLADLADAPSEIRANAVCLLDEISKLAAIKCVTTPGAVVTILLEPSDFLLNICVAVRTGKFDNLVVGNEHCFSSVDSGLVELPSLSTLEKLPISMEEIEK
ncbi:MAG: hypothetical protein JSR71_09265 [Proteobacteria bacterium]|nr:hypothetical protein [Pseudomonadota bacterium]